MISLIENQLHQLMQIFRGRLSDHLLNFACNYISHGESKLAFETLCDYICEEDVKIKAEEYEKIIEIGTEFKSDLKAGRFAYIKRLVEA